MKAIKLFVPALAVTLTGTAFGQANDDCSGAIAASLGTTAFDTTAATAGFPMSCGNGDIDIWYSYTATSANDLDIDLCGSTYDTVLEIYSGTCAAPISIACNDDFCGLQSGVQITGVNVGDTFLIQIGGFNGAQGTGTLNIAENVPPPPPMNDECATATAVMLGSTAYDSSGATTSSPAVSCPFGTGTAEDDVWFTYTATSTMDLNFETCGSSYDTVMEVYTGTCAALASVGCNDDACGLQSGVVVSGVNVGDVFYIQVAGWNAAAGAGTFTVSELVPPQPNCVETLFAANNGGAPGGAVYFDITVTQPVSFSGLLCNTSASGVPIGLSVYTAPLTSVGNETVPGAWTLVAEDDGTPVGLGQNAETAVTFAAPFNLAPGTYGLAIVGESPTTFLQMDHDYTNGTGTNQNYASADGVVSLALGTASNAPFTGGLFSPRVWNGELCHGAGSGGPGVNYCTANANSTGNPAVMSASGTANVGNNDLVLEASDMPNNSFAFFLTSQVQGLVMNPGGSAGNLCLGGAIGRYVGPGQVQNSGNMGAVSLAVDLTMHPTPTGLVSVNAGETWNFTCWFRDAVGGQATSNFADGLEILFN